MKYYRQFILSSALLVPSLVGLSGCGSLLETVDNNSSTSSSSSSSADITKGNEVDVFSLSVGDCIVEPNDNSAAGYSEIPKVPCSEPHDAEVYFSSLLPQGSYPGADAVNTTAEQVCSEQFANFTGVGYNDETTLDFWYFSPTQQTWQEIDDREILCLVYPLDETKLTGSASGLGVAGNPEAVQ